MKFFNKIFLVVTFLISLNCYAQPCGGTERWDVKVLADPEESQIDFSPLATTVNWLRKQNVHRTAGDASRQGIEFKTYEVKCYIKFYKKEDDGDIHIVICDTKTGTKTMIAEVPGIDCSLVSQSGFKDQFKAVWKVIDDNTTGHSGNEYYMKKKKYTIDAVAFMDFDHNQTGHAPNDLELHPIIYIK